MSLLVKMLKAKELFEVFSGKNDLRPLLSHRLSIKDGLITYAVVFLIVSILFSIESLVGKLIFGLLGTQDITALLIELLIVAVVCIVLTPIILVTTMVCTYLWGAFHFFLAGLYSKGHQLNEFNANVFGLFSATFFVGGLIALIPVIGWIAFLLVKIYTAFLMFKLVRNHFNLNSTHTLIVVLVPLNIVLLFLLVISFVVSGILVGPIFI